MCDVYSLKDTSCDKLKHLSGMLGMFALDDNEGCPIGQILKWGLDEVTPLFPDEPQYKECRFDFIYGGEIIDAITDNDTNTVTVKTDKAEYIFEYTNYEAVV